jgi:hypothetical protein
VQSCAHKPANPVEDLSGAQDLSKFTLQSLKGTRDGDRLDAVALFSDNARTLTVQLRFEVNPQARLQSGTWTGFDSSGAVAERSTTFLGGQSAPPSLGGRYDLTGPDHRTLYRVTIPLQPLQDRL